MGKPGSFSILKHHSKSCLFLSPPCHTQGLHWSHTPPLRPLRSSHFTSAPVPPLQPPWHSRLSNPPLTLPGERGTSSIHLPCLPSTCPRLAEPLTPTWTAKNTAVAPLCFRCSSIASSKATDKYKPSTPHRGQRELLVLSLRNEALNKALAWMVE